MPHFIEFNYDVIVNWRRFGIVIFCKRFYPNERRVNVDCKKLGNGPERISVCIYPDCQTFFLLAPSFMLYQHKLAGAFFIFHVLYFTLYIYFRKRSNLVKVAVLLQKTLAHPQELLFGNNLYT